MADKSDGEEKGKDEEKAKGGKGKLIIMLLPTLLLVAGAGWYFFLRSDAPAKVVLPTPTAGAVVKLDPITINLAGGHFLKLGMALQSDASAGAELDGSRSLDLAISQFSGRTLDELATTEGRLKAKDELVARIKFAYLPETPDAETAAQTAMKEGMGGAPSAGAKTADATKPAGTASAATGGAGAAATETKMEAAQLNAAQVTAAAAQLTVLSQVYDIYFTEFVMQ